jgi:hypothetical protein
MVTWYRKFIGECKAVFGNVIVSFLVKGRLVWKEFWIF